ncbi:septum formation initiator family protein [Cardiobacteriaceae bacterium TAE3-ERU3]|nr:septum formation initiator family protein [Cardiobacteriaceae bacterium TAE3-ERU3]
MKRAVLYGLMLLIIAALVWLNYYLWVTQHEKKQSIEGLQTQIQLHQSENKSLADRNDALLVEVENLRSPDAYFAYEEKAREDYGMIGQNETYFVLPDSELASLPDVPGLAPDPVAILNPDQSSIELESIETNAGGVPATTEILPVTPLPLQLESIQE